MLAGRSWDDWIAQYAKSHQHPVNRVCHTFGIPLIVLSLVLAVVSFFVSGLWIAALTDSPIRRPRRRGQAARVLSRLAIPARRVALVDREDARTRLT